MMLILVCHLQEISKYSSMVPAVNQCEFHPHFRRDEIRRYCKEHNIFFQVRMFVWSWISSFEALGLFFAWSL